jgi:hypothetical protein
VLLREVDPAATVVGCAWTVADLAGHLGSIHRWATAILRTGALADEPPAEGDPAEWYAAGWPPLLEALAAADLDAACWGFGPRPRCTCSTSAAPAGSPRRCPPTSPPTGSPR